MSSVSALLKENNVFLESRLSIATLKNCALVSRKHFYISTEPEQLNEICIQDEMFSHVLQISNISCKRP